MVLGETSREPLSWPEAAASRHSVTVGSAISASRILMYSMHPAEGRCEQLDDSWHAYYLGFSPVALTVNQSNQIDLPPVNARFRCAQRSSAAG
jgi:hypothetical protein